MITVIMQNKIPNCSYLNFASENCSCKPLQANIFSLLAKLHFCPFLGWSIPGSLQDHDLLILFDFWWAFKNKVDQETSKEDLKDTHGALRSKCSLESILSFTKRWMLWFNTIHQKHLSICLKLSAYLSSLEVYVI